MIESTEWPVEDGKIAMAVMGSSGDTKKIWDKNNPDEVADAHASFDRLKDKGYLAFSVNKAGDKGDQIHTFDPDAERLIMSPAMRGG